MHRRGMIKGEKYETYELAKEGQKDRDDDDKRGSKTREERRQSNVGRSIYRSPRLLDGIIAWGVKLQSRTQLVARGFESLSPPFLLPQRPTGGGHVMDACTHVHKVHLCEHRGKSRDDVNDPAVGFQSRLFLSLSFSFSLLREPLLLITNHCITPSCPFLLFFFSFPPSISRP